MMMRTFVAGLALAAALIAPAAASADTAIATTNVNLRAGPGTQYPVAATVAAGAGVEVYGCLQDYSWCDVDFRGIRGWMAARYLQEGGEILLPAQARAVAVPTVTYDLDDYWYTHYRATPFYARRDYYRTWRPAPLAPAPFPAPVIGGGYGVGYGWNNGWNRNHDHDRWSGHDQAQFSRGDHRGDSERLVRRDRRERSRELATESYGTPTQVCRRGVCMNR